MVGYLSYVMVKSGDYTNVLWEFFLLMFLLRPVEFYGLVVKSILPEAHFYLEMKEKCGESVGLLKEEL